MTIGRVTEDEKQGLQNPPQEIKTLIEGEDYSIDEIGMSDSTVIMFQDKILKIQKETLETQGELKMMKWLEDKLPVPKIMCHTTQDEESYLLMSRIQGKMSCKEEYLDNPRLLVSILAHSLKRLWQVDISECPVRMDLDVKLAIAKYNVENGLVDLGNVEPETFGEGGFENPEALLEWLVANRPEEELVLSHGDFCLPNIFIKEDKLSGYIDLGRMGIADKWLDIAICYRSLKHNYEGKYGGKVYKDFNPEILFDALEIEPDWDKIHYYILLDELF